MQIDSLRLMARSLSDFNPAQAGYSTVFLLGLALLLPACSSDAGKQAPAAPKQAVGQQAAAPDVGIDEDLMPILKTPWKGDLDEMVKRRIVRVLVPFRRPEFFYIDGRPAGILHEAFLAVETELNLRYKTNAANRIVLALLPTPSDRFADRMTAGYADIAAGSISITDQHKQFVDFTAPTTSGLKIIPVTGPGAPELKSLDDLSGKEVWVMGRTRMKQDLEALNARLKSQGKAPAVMRETDPVLEPGDVMEMVNAGVYPITLMQSMAAEFWAQVFTAVKPRPDLALAEDVELGWAIQKNTPKLKAFLDGFMTTHRAGTAFGSTLMRRYLKEAKYVRNATEENELIKFKATAPYFREYSAKYNLDALLLAAQGYQESRLDQNVKSPVGAIGIMQVMPTTAASSPVNVKNITNERNNIHAGARLMNFLIEDHFNEPGINLHNRMLFAMAAYNAGPARISKCREQAKQMGYDPNVWFNNVEVAVAKAVGRETTQYVANIYKYYVCYRMAAEIVNRNAGAVSKAAKK